MAGDLNRIHAPELGACATNSSAEAQPLLTQERVTTARRLRDDSAGSEQEPGRRDWRPVWGTADRDTIQPPALSRSNPATYLSPCFGHMDATTAKNAAFWGGVCDGQQLSQALRAPALRDPVLELLYLKGFFVGAADFGRTLLRAPELGLSAGDHARAAPRTLRQDPTSFSSRSPAGATDGLASALSMLGTEDAPRASELVTWEGSLLLPPALLPAAQGMAPRPSSHEQPLPGTFTVSQLHGVPRPVGVARGDIAKEWPDDERAVLFAQGGRGCWLFPERRFPERFDFALLVEVLEELSAAVFPGRPRLRATQRKSKFTSIQAAFVYGEPDQVTTLLRPGAWSTPWLSFFTIPNEPTAERFVCVYAGSKLSREDHGLARYHIREEIAASLTARTFMTTRGYAFEHIVATLDLEFVRLPYDAEGQYDPPDDESQRTEFFWNVYVDMPELSPEDLWEWRATVADLRPGDKHTGVMYSSHRFFWCNTCGALNHPEELCPTMHYPEWMGYRPRLPPV